MFSVDRSNFIVCILYEIQHKVSQEIIHSCLTTYIFFYSVSLHSSKTNSLVKLFCVVDYQVSGHSMNISQLPVYPLDSSTLFDRNQFSFWLYSLIFRMGIHPIIYGLLA